jgi:hypothetical protein
MKSENLEVKMVERYMTDVDVIYSSLLTYHRAETEDEGQKVTFRNEKAGRRTGIRRTDERETGNGLQTNEKEFSFRHGTRTGSGGQASY